MDTGDAADDDAVVVVVESDADEVDGDFLLLDFFSFCNYHLKLLSPPHYIHSTVILRRYRVVLRINEKSES